MKHPILWIIGGVALVVVAALGFGAWYLFADDAPAKPTLSDSAAVDAGGPATPVGTWKVAPGSNVYVGYRMTEVFAGDVIHKTAVGRTPDVSGTMTIAGNQVTAATVTAQMQQLSSNRGARDNYIHTHAIESDSFPTAVFKLTKPIALSSPFTKGTKVKVNATGTLTLHGVTRTVTVPLEARWTGPTIEAVGNIPIVLADYDIEPPDTGVVKVDDHGSMDVSLTFIPS